MKFEFVDVLFRCTSLGCFALSANRPQAETACLAKRAGCPFASFFRPSNCRIVDIKKISFEEVLNEVTIFSIKASEFLYC